jgi:LAO/AO transport system kinase
MEELIKKLLEGDKRTIARAISLVENNEPSSKELMKKIYAHTGNAYIIGITGAPGTGKSTLINCLAQEYLSEGKKIGIILVDPSSPFTGGAIFGNRIRMQELSNHEDVYIRSMATRGYLGGVSRATSNTIKILDAAGKDVIIVETVGTGQSDVNIFKKAYTNIVVTVPGLGDYVQALKAGILEIGDIFVVNKADREGADQVVSELEEMLNMGKKKEWKAKIIKTIATERKGIKELYNSIKEHQSYMLSGALKEKKEEIAKFELIELIEQNIFDLIMKEIEDKDFNEIIKK